MKSIFNKKPPANEDMSLQITSMADIFMILLVFLLKSYSTTISNLAPTTKMELPLASHKLSGEIKETVKLEISRDAIIIDQKPVVMLQGFEFRSNELKQNGQNEAIFNVLFE